MYSRFVWQFIKVHGYDCPNLILPTPDQYDAMLCAIVAQKCAEKETYKLAGTVGSKSFLDFKNRVIREGYIVSL